MVDGRLKTLLVHRKGSTRAFPPHHPLIPVDYQLTGQPVLIGGTMGTCSYVLTGACAAAAAAAVPLTGRPAAQLAAGQRHRRVVPAAEPLAGRRGSGMGAACRLQGQWI
jgi:hypothetical protein